MPKKEPEKKTVINLPSLEHNGEKKRCKLTGSWDSDYATILANQVINCLPLKAYSEDDKALLRKAALTSMMGLAPQDEVEGMLACQMAATHFAAMRSMVAVKNSETVTQQDSNGNLAVKLMRTYTMQMEALNRYRGKGQQKMTVEHVHVHAGGQAIVGNVNHPEGGGVQKKREEQPHAKTIPHAPEQTMPSQNTKRKAVPVPRNA